MSWGSYLASRRAPDGWFPRTICLRAKAPDADISLDGLRDGVGQLISAVSALNIGQLLRHLTIPYPEQVQTPDVTRLSVLSYPVINPADHAAVPSGKHLLGLK